MYCVAPNGARLDIGWARPFLTLAAIHSTALWGLLQALSIGATIKHVSGRSRRPERPPRPRPPAAAHGSASLDERYVAKSPISEPR